MTHCVRNPSRRCATVNLLLLGATTLALAAALPALGQPDPAASATGSAPEAREVSPSFRLGPGDVLEVMVPTHDGFNASLTVQPDGRIYYPFVGEIVATGLTIPDLTEKIRQGLSQQLRNPQVTIWTREVRPGINRVTVTGAVRVPNSVELRENWRVSDAIAAVGGVTERADLKQVTFWHDGRPETLDLSRLLIDNRLDKNPPVSPGDFLVVPERPRVTVSVTGEGVHNQGSFEIDDPEPTILKALQRANGYSERADLKHAELIRAGHPAAPLDLDALLLHGDMSLNRPLQDGDAIHVPILDARVFVFGEVLKPDAIPLKPGISVLDVLGAAAPTHDADLNRAVLVRKQASGERKAIPLHLGRLRKADLSANLPLENGDVLVIPAKGHKLGLQDMLQVLYPIDLLARMAVGAY